MKHWVIVLALLGASSGCHRVEAVEHVVYWADRPSIAMMAEFQAVAAGARLADSVEILEGLPNPMFEHDAFAAEVAAKPIVRLGPGYAFYARPIDLRPDDVERLRGVCVDAANFRMPKGVPLCGGFHADYAVRWQHGDRMFVYLFCFSCAEGEMYLGGAKTLDVDILSSAFVPLLGKYRAERPEHPPFR